MKKKIYYMGLMLLFAFPANAQQDTIQKNKPSDKQLLALARQYRYGIIKEANPEKAVKILSYLARNNNATALNELGKCYLNGDGVNKNALLAYKLFSKAAKLGNDNALCNLALIYQKGLNGTANFKKAYLLYKKAAENGSVQGLYGSGYLLYKGLGVKQNYEEAVKLLEQGAEKGHPGCSMLLASYYSNGYDKEQDLSKAEKYWKKASRDGNSWTVDVTKNGLVDSINKRISRKNTWSHVKNHVLKDENMPEIKSTIDAHNIEGVWTGKAYSYDWSKKNILKEQDIKMDIKCIDDSAHIEIYMDDSLSTSYSSILDGNKYISKKLTSEQRQYSWTVTQTLFDTKDNYLFADLKVLNFKSRSFSKPLLAVLNRDNSNDIDSETPFSIASVQYKSGKLKIVIDASQSMNVGISASSVTGLVRLPSCSRELHPGHNTIVIPALFEKSDVVAIVTISHKNERHSKTITVNGRE